MQRVLIVGPCGAGKSTLAAELGPILGLPVYHMDQLNWKPGWVESSKGEILEKLAQITASDRWQPAGQQRAAVYSHLEPGQYRFRLQARLPGRIWVEAARQLEVAVAPRIWEADWFRALAVGLVLLALAAFFHWRVRKERELRAKQAELRQLASRLIRAQDGKRAFQFFLAQ